jgi:AbrB family looped-hinge helix DNA binding protein
MACEFYETRQAATMTTLVVSSKGQIVLPAALRRRLGLGAGARLELWEEPDGLRLRVVRAQPSADLEGLAGIVKAPARGEPRRLEDFDPASLLGTEQDGGPEQEGDQ